MPTDPGSGILKYPAPTPGHGQKMPTDRDEGYYESLLRADPKWGAQYADAYAKYVTVHPGHTAYQNLMLFVGEITAKGIAKVISETTQLEGQIPGAAAKGAENAINVLGGFNIGNWFIRIGEILLGLVLVGVGIARLTGAQNAISKIVKSKVPIPV